MIRLALLLVAGLSTCLAMPSSAQAPTSAEALQTLFADEWERSLRDSPEVASSVGDTRYDDRWTDLRLGAIAAREAADRTALERLQAIDRRTLPASGQSQYDTFEWQLLRAVERQKFREYLQPIDHQGGPQTADGIAEMMPFATVADCRKFLARMAALPELIDQSIALMREGVKVGHMPPRVRSTPSA